MKAKVYSIFVLSMAILQLLLILGSWIVTAAMPDLPLHSLLSAEGIRWFLGQFVSNAASPLLVWLLLFGMAWGALRNTSILAGGNFKRRNPRRRFALSVIWVETVVFAVIIILLAFMPNAILLNVTGRLFPSSFSDSVIPLLCLYVCMVSISYGWAEESIKSMSDVIDAFSSGIARIAPLLVVYILAVQLYYSVLFVF